MDNIKYLLHTNVTAAPRTFTNVEAAARVFLDTDARFMPKVVREGGPGGNVAIAYTLNRQPQSTETATNSNDLPAIEDPRYRQMMQGLKDITAAINGEESSPVRFSTDQDSSIRGLSVRVQHATAKVDANPGMSQADAFDSVYQEAISLGIADYQRGLGINDVPTMFMDESGLKNAWQHGWESEQTAVDVARGLERLGEWNPNITPFNKINDDGSVNTAGDSDVDFPEFDTFQKPIKQEGNAADWTHEKRVTALDPEFKAAFERAVHFDRHFYPGTKTLINHFGEQNPRKLGILERQHASLAAVHAREFPIPGNYDFAHIQAIHKHMFGGVYPWAGEIRDHAMFKPRPDGFVSEFARPEEIKGLDAKLKGIMAETGNFTRLLPGEFPEKIASVYQIINEAHPFREGNGRSHRIYLDYLATNAGQKLDFSLVTKEAWNYAASMSGRINPGDGSPRLDGRIDELKRVFSHISSPAIATASNAYAAGRQGSAAPAEKKVMTAADIQQTQSLSAGRKLR